MTWEDQRGSAIDGARPRGEAASVDGWRTASERGNRVHEPNGDDRAKVRRLLDRVAANRVDDPAEARTVAHEARVEARACGSRLDEAEALYQLASIAHQFHDTETAFALASEAVELADDGEANLTLAWSLHLIGVVHYQATNLAASLEACLRSLDVYRATRDEVNEGKILHTIAAVHQSMGDYARAIETYEAALAINEPLGRRDLDAMVMGNLARIRGRRGEPAPAIEIGRAAVELARRHAPQLVGGLLADLAEAYVGLGDHASAALCFAEARADWEHRTADGDALAPVEQLGVMVSEGRVALRSGHLDEAIASLSAALDLADRTDMREIELEVHDHLAGAYKQAGRHGEALEHRERQFALHREIFNDATDLRLRTLQVTHDNQVARQRSELTRLKSEALANEFALDHADVDAYHLEAFERLASLAEFRGGNTTRHTSAVGDLSAEIGHALGERPEWCERLRLAARLHDIGKIAIADSVLLKPGPLDIDEFDEVKQHTVLGRRLLSGVSTDLFELAAECAWSHHEWWDGSGYPSSLSGTAIPLSGRIVAIADVYDSLATRRIYKREWSVNEAVRFVASGSGEQFQPALIDAFVRVMCARHPELSLSP
ncbi:HD domain-containing phosphohydrolase [Ilumatobacter sp.]|uniref:HD domain-containing phosphohydrolase n=1 Tax=Ilumatobacter sp. TaxID=1967498 RepID=UPI003B52EF0B